MHPRYWLTWKRGKQLYPAWIIATIPLFATVLASAVFSVPLPWKDSFALEILLVGIVVSVVIAGGVYHFTRTAAEVLYYPPLHLRRWLVVSTISLMGLGVVLTYLSYLVLVVPLSYPILPHVADIGVGLVLAAGYALLLSAWRTRVFRNDRKAVSKTEAAGKIRESLADLRSDCPELSDTEVLVDGLQKIAQEYEREPLINSSDSADIIRLWCEGSWIA